MSRERNSPTGEMIELRTLEVVFFSLSHVRGWLDVDNTERALGSLGDAESMLLTLRERLERNEEQRASMLAALQSAALLIKEMSANKTELNDALNIWRDLAETYRSSNHVILAERHASLLRRRRMFVVALTLSGIATGLVAARRLLRRH